jgi:hypothetical protein
VFKIFAYLCFVGICPQEPGEKNQKVTLRVCTGICPHKPGKKKSKSNIKSLYEPGKKNQKVTLRVCMNPEKKIKK